jgi:hypothetical protein
MTEEQISKWITGDRSAKDERHVGECPLCRKEFAGFQDALAEFRSSFLRLADRQGAVKVPDAASLLRAPRSFRARRLLWTPLAAALVILSVIIPSYRNSIQRQRQAQAIQDAQLDAQLLEQVNGHLSRKAPASLQPLVDLFASTNENTKQNEGAHR